MRDGFIILNPNYPGIFLVINKIDRLANSGTRYTQAYATAPICNASRIAIMSGCYQQRGRVLVQRPGAASC